MKLPPLFYVIPKSMVVNIIHLLARRCSNNQVNLRIWGLIRGTMARNGVEIIKITYEI